MDTRNAGALALCLIVGLGASPGARADDCSTTSLAACVGGTCYTTLHEALDAAPSGTAASYTVVDLCYRETPYTAPARLPAGKEYIHVRGELANGKRPHIVPDTLLSRAGLSLDGDNLFVENVEISGLPPSVDPNVSNGAIWFRGNDLTLRNVYVHDSQASGFTSTGGDGGGTIIIENSIFENLGVDPSLPNLKPHSIYAAAPSAFTGQLIVRGSLVQGAQAGHEVKSKALNTRVEYNIISSADELRTDGASVEPSYGGLADIWNNTLRIRDSDRRVIRFGFENEIAQWPDRFPPGAIGMVDGAAIHDNLVFLELPRGGEQFLVVSGIGGPIPPERFSASGNIFVDPAPAANLSTLHGVAGIYETREQAAANPAWPAHAGTATKPVPILVVGDKDAYQAGDRKDAPSRSREMEALLAQIETMPGMNPGVDLDIGGRPDDGRYDRPIGVTHYIPPLTETIIGAEFRFRVNSDDPEGGFFDDAVYLDHLACPIPGTCDGLYPLIALQDLVGYDPNDPDVILKNAGTAPMVGVDYLFSIDFRVPIPLRLTAPASGMPWAGSPDLFDLDLLALLDDGRLDVVFLDDTRVDYTELRLEFGTLVAAPAPPAVLVLAVGLAALLVRTPRRGRAGGSQRTNP